MEKTIEQITAEIKAEVTADFEKKFNELKNQSSGANSAMVQAQKDRDVAIELAKKSKEEFENSKNSTLSDSEKMRQTIDELTGKFATMTTSFELEKQENQKLIFRSQSKEILEKVAKEKGIPFELVSHLVVDHGDLQNLQVDYTEKTTVIADAIQKTVHAKIIDQSNGVTPPQTGNPINKDGIIISYH